MATYTSDPVVPVQTLTPPDIHAYSRRHEIARAPWWIAYPVAVVLLALLDVVLGYWRPFPQRLPEQFSPAYLRLYVADMPRDRPVVAWVGDSVLWGYKIDALQTAIGALQQALPHDQMLNLAYEGGSTPNSAIMMRYLLSQGVRPAAVVANVNIKEFNANDSAYNTLHPSLEIDAQPVLTADDKRMLSAHIGTELNARFGRAVERVWRLYRLRADLRERIFGTDDMATALLGTLQRLTGTTKDREAEHRPTSDKFLGTYDLTPLDDTNTGMRYYRVMIDDLCSRHIPALLFLTPTNHKLLHDYIDVPDYDANLQRLLRVPHCGGVHIVNFDRLIPASDFIDNDHLNPAGQQILAAHLKPYVRDLVK